MFMILSHQYDEKFQPSSFKTVGGDRGDRRMDGQTGLASRPASTDSQPYLNSCPSSICCVYKLFMFLLNNLKIVVWLLKGVVITPKETSNLKNIFFMPSKMNDLKEEKLHIVF